MIGHVRIRDWRQPAALSGMAVALLTLGADPLGVSHGLGSSRTAVRVPPPTVRVEPRRVESRRDRAERQRAFGPARAVRPVLVASVHVRSGAIALAASSGALWVSGFGAVSRLDPATGHLVRIRTPDTEDYSAIAIGEGSVWVTADRGSVYRIDPSANRVVATIHVGGSVQGIAVGAGRVWVARPLQGAGDVIRIDPHSNRNVGPPIKVGPGPAQMIYGQRAVWVQNTSPASVMRIDPATGQVATVVGTHAVPYGSFVVGAIAIGYGSLWAAANDLLTRIDPRTGQVEASLHIPRAEYIAIGDGEVWVLAAPRSRSPSLFYAIKHTAALSDVDPTNNRIIGKPVRLSALQPIAVTASHKSMWVADYSSATVTRFRFEDHSSRAGV